MHRHGEFRLGKRTKAVESGLLLYPQNAVLCRLGDSEFDDGLGWNLDLLLCLGIEARTCFPLLLYELTKAGQDEFTILFYLFVCELAKRIEEYASGSLPFPYSWRKRFIASPSNAIAPAGGEDLFRR
jgi:hypothetical protein